MMSCCAVNLCRPFKQNSKVDIFSKNSLNTNLRLYVMVACIVNSVMSVCKITFK